jgi:hypothetical protein
VTLHPIRAWEEADDVDVRRSQAMRQRAHLDGLRDDPGWALVASALEAELDRRRAALEASSKDDERHRGAIEVIRWVLGAPDAGIERAINEIGKIN